MLSNSQISLKLRLFLWLRWVLTPYSEMIKNIKRSGLYFDIGCGHGLLTYLLGSQSERKVIACDHDIERIKIAQNLCKNFSNIDFFQGGFQEALIGLKLQAKFDGIFLIDVLHYLDHNEQEQLLKLIKNSLAVDGLFIMREVHPHAGFISKLNQLYEWLATKSGFTKSQNQSNTFKTPEEWSHLLKNCGFSHIKSRKCTFWLFADYLIEAKIQHYKDNG